VTEFLGALEQALGSRVMRAVQVAGGASKEAWAIDTGDGCALFLRRALGGAIHMDTLSLADEFETIVAARDAGVTVAEPIAYLGVLEGREAFVTARLEGETIGRRIVRDPPQDLDLRMAEELARIHAISRERVQFLPEPDLFARLEAELDAVDEPHPAIEYGLAWCREHIPLDRPRVVLHGDFRVGNLMVSEGTLAAVLDWEFAHVGDPAGDVAWPFVRAWRFGADELRLGGIANVDRYLERYAELTGTEIPAPELHAWEVLGNCKWAIGSLSQARRHLRGEERSVELAILGRLAVEMELELLDLIGARPGGGDEPVEVAHDRPSAGELAAAVREFLEQELLPTVDDHRLKFRTLVAMNALGIVERESPEPVERDGTLADAIRQQGTRAVDPESLRGDVERRMEVASPRLLARYRGHDRQ